jgi:hypothetical protein
MTDVVMPEMNGRNLAGNLMSAYPSIIAHHGLLDEGVHFIYKPFSMTWVQSCARPWQADRLTWDSTEG